MGFSMQNVVPQVLARMRACMHACMCCGCPQVKASIGNIIVGKPTVNHTGTFWVENKGTGLAAVMELVKPPMLTMSSKKRSLHEVPPHNCQFCKLVAACSVIAHVSHARHMSALFSDPPAATGLTGEALAR